MGIIEDEIIVHSGLTSYKMVLKLKLSVFSMLTNVNLLSVLIRQVDTIYRTRAKKD